MVLPVQVLVDGVSPGEAASADVLRDLLLPAKTTELARMRQQGDPRQYWSQAGLVAVEQALGHGQTPLPSLEQLQHSYKGVRSWQEVVAAYAALARGSPAEDVAPVARVLSKIHGPATVEAAAAVSDALAIGHKPADIIAAAQHPEAPQRALDPLPPAQIQANLESIAQEKPLVSNATYAPAHASVPVGHQAAVGLQRTATPGQLGMVFALVLLALVALRGA